MIQAFLEHILSKAGSKLEPGADRSSCHGFLHWGDGSKIIHAIFPQ